MSFFFSPQRSRMLTIVAFAFLKNVFGIIVDIIIIIILTPSGAFRLDQYA